MNAENTLYTLKGQAQRLQNGLAAIGKPITRAQALDLVAQMQGKRDWKELSGLEKAGQAREAKKAVDQSAWLERLFYVLRLAEFSEEDLDDLLHDVLASDEASWVNNQGMAHQLAVLLEEYDFDRAALVARLESALEQPLSMPEGTGTELVIPASMSICAGFPEEAGCQFDALEWALQASADDLAAVVRGRYRNCDATDDIGLWMESHAADASMRTEVQELLAAMRAIVRIKPDRPGITVHVDEDTFAEFVSLRRHFDGYPFDESVLGQLGIE
jgi:hypothetical protein